MEEAFPSISRQEAIGRCTSIEVTATARLHFGFLDPSGRGARPFGSFGLSLDRPRTRLILRRASEFEVRGPEAGRATTYLRALTEARGLPATYGLRIAEAIPPHSGLGSGTQLALAVGTAFSRLEDASLHPKAIAEMLERGRRSGIGIATFLQGGAVLDGGPGPEGALPPLLCRVPFPPQWRVVLIFDDACTGIHGEDEKAAFASSLDFPESQTAELCRRILQCALPALIEEDFPTFSMQIGFMQANMGAYFSSQQGGAYVSAKVASALNWLLRRGLTGLGQSSWGPTGFAFVPSEQEGESLLSSLRQNTVFEGLRFELAAGRNVGAEIVAS